MKPSLLTAALVALTPLGLAAQSDRAIAHQQTSAIAAGRYEIIQSSLGARFTFRLDRYAGHVSQLVMTKDSTTAWEDMPVLERPNIPTPTRARFQIFTSGMGARYTFLIDVDTGKTWELFSAKAKDKDGKEVEYTGWQPLDK